MRLAAARGLRRQICAVHGGHGNLNNYLFDDIRVEGAQWGFVSVHIKRNPWSPPAVSVGSISTVLLRNITAEGPFPAPPPDAFAVAGNASVRNHRRSGHGLGLGLGLGLGARVDTLVYDSVRIAGRLLEPADVQAGIGEYATNVTVCEGCTACLVPQCRGDGAACGWTRAQVCGKAPQPFVNGVQLPPLADPDVHPYCA